MIALDIPPGGMHVIGRIAGQRNDVALAARAQRAGLAPFPLSSCAKLSAGNRQISGNRLTQWRIARACHV
jgi:hypothetical protein